MFRGCCVKVFSRKQEVPALSSAEAELYSLVENAKELIAVALLLETILAGIELDVLGTPLRLTGSYSLILRNDAKAAISIAQMQGLLRRVRHIELRAKYLQWLATDVTERHEVSEKSEFPLPEVSALSAMPKLGPLKPVMEAAAKEAADREAAWKENLTLPRKQMEKQR
eukprot:s1596_g1.t1